jgi:hypothetical protein
LLDDLKENHAYQPQKQKVSPGTRSDVTELTEKVQFRKDTKLIDPPMNKVPANPIMKAVGIDLAEL